MNISCKYRKNIWDEQGFLAFIDYSFCWRRLPIGERGLIVCFNKVCCVLTSSGMPSCMIEGIKRTENFFWMGKDTQQKTVTISFASREKQRSFLREKHVCKEQKGAAKCEKSVIVVSSWPFLTIKQPRWPCEKGVMMENSLENFSSERLFCKTNKCNVYSSR